MIYPNYTRWYKLIMNNLPQKPQLLFHSPDIINLLSGLRIDPQYAKNLTRYNDKVYKVADTKVSYRTINSWEGANLLLGGQNKGAKWRKFSLIEVMWLQIIRELRELGFSTKKILVLKNSLFQIRKEYGDLDTATFGVYLFSINAKRDVLIVVDNEGVGDFAIDIEYELSQRTDTFPNTHIVLNLNKIYAGFADLPEYRKRNQDFYIYDNKQLQILNAIYNDPLVKEIIIKPKDGKMDKLDFKRRTSNPKDVVEFVNDAIKKGERREITIKIEPQKVVSLVDVLKK